MADQTNKAATVGSVVGLVLAVAAGRFIGWAFGLSFVLPVIVGLVAADRFKKQPQLAPWAPAIGLMMAHLTWIFLGIILDAIGGRLHFGVWWVLLTVAYIAFLVFLIVQPGIVPALLLILRHAYTLVNVLLGIPALIKYGTVLAYINTTITVGVAIGVIVLLALAINKTKSP